MEWQEIIFKEKVKIEFKNLTDNDLIIISDLDEIPNLDNVDFESKNNIIIFNKNVLL